MASALSSSPWRVIKTKDHRKRAVAEALILTHHQTTHTPRKAPDARPIKVVCISDTHNEQPIIPPGDILIHAGDLTENGAFQEVQDGLTWLSSLPHKHKIFVAGNHDVLLDDGFLEKYPARRYGSSQSKQDLDWGSVTYLEDSATRLEFDAEDGRGARSITIFGSPWTPQYGIPALQYRSDPDYWETKMASLDRTPDVVVTHGPPRLHLDRRDSFTALGVRTWRNNCAAFGRDSACLATSMLRMGAKTWCWMLHRACMRASWSVGQVGQDCCGLPRWLHGVE